MTTQEHAWTAIRTQHPDVSHDVMVVASGSDPCGKRLKSGSLRLWQLIDQATDRLEVLVSGEGLRRSPATLATGCCLAGRAGRRHSNRPCCSSYPGAVLPSTATAVERYFLGLEIYSNEPIPASAGPA